MEPTSDQFHRRTIPGLWPRFALWTALVFAINMVHSHFRPELSTWLRAHGLADIWFRGFTILLIPFTFTGLAGLVVCYYFSLRERRIHSALTEGGLAFRTVFAALLALAALELATYVNLGGFDG